MASALTVSAIDSWHRPVSSPIKGSLMLLRRSAAALRPSVEQIALTLLPDGGQAQARRNAWRALQESREAAEIIAAFTMPEQPAAATGGTARPATAERRVIDLTDAHLAFTAGARTAVGGS